MMEFLRENSTLLFGTGGIGAFVLALWKFRRDAKAKSGSAPTPAKADPTIRTGNIGGDFVGRDKTTKTGFGALELGIVVCGFVAIVGLFLMQSSSDGNNTATADHGATAVAGDGNTVTKTDQ